MNTSTLLRMNATHCRSVIRLRFSVEQAVCYCSSDRSVFQGLVDLQTGSHRVKTGIVWLKLQAMREGAVTANMNFPSPLSAVVPHSSRHRKRPVAPAVLRSKAGGES